MGRGRIAAASLLTWEQNPETARNQARPIMLVPGRPKGQQEEETEMDKDRIKGAADQAKGSIKKAAGDLTGDQKLKGEGMADKAKGKVESAVGSAKDAARDAEKD